MHDKCNDEPMVTFPAAESHHPLASTTLCYFVSLWPSCSDSWCSCALTGSHTPGNQTREHSTAVHCSTSYPITQNTALMCHVKIFGLI